jgi:hypothetical protein
MKSVYEDIAVKIAALVEQKQEAYGDAFGKITKILRVLYPYGITPSEYQNLGLVIRILDKLARIAEHNGDDPMQEDSWRDICGYSILAQASKPEDKDGEEE